MARTFPSSDQDKVAGARRKIERSSQHGAQHDPRQHNCGAVVEQTFTLDQHF